MSDGYGEVTPIDSRRGDVPALVDSGSPLVSVARRSPSKSWVGIVANAASGTGLGRAKVKTLVKILRRHGLRPRIAWTPDDRKVLVGESHEEKRCRCLVAVGGDGTVAALINEFPSVPITTLPTGTENLFARHFHLTRSPAKLAATIEHGHVVRTDLGQSQERRFVLMAGFGFDAEVVTRHHEARIAQTGMPRPTNRVAYVEPVLRSSFSYPFHPMTVEITDPGREETISGSNIFVFNLPRYALGLPFAPAAKGDDGFLDLVVFRNPGPFQALHYLWLVFRRLHLDRPGVEHRKIRRAIIRTAETVPVQLDGDPGGLIDKAARGPCVVEVLPGAIDVLVPKSH